MMEKCLEDALCVEVAPVEPHVHQDSPHLGSQQAQGGLDQRAEPSQSINQLINQSRNRSTNHPITSSPFEKKLMKIHKGKKNEDKGKRNNRRRKKENKIEEVREEERKKKA